MKLKKKPLLIIIGLIIGSILYSCVKEEEYPIIPEIKYEDFILLYNPVSGFIERGVLKITFKDGDGDIGLIKSEANPPYDYNLFISYFEIRYGDTVPIYNNPFNGDTIIFNSTIPNLTPEGPVKAISGEIQDTLYINYPNSEFDTIMFEVYLVDRAEHQSNIISTPLIKRNFD
ncbi:MAG: hypothetical protein K9H58_04480 [Bacteroidales bacterium]|nr:hypothetical protein [Bacteroidales bacterium]